MGISYQVELTKSIILYTTRRESGTAPTMANMNYGEQEPASGRDIGDATYKAGFLRCECRLHGRETVRKERDREREREREDEFND